jgi:hypothetical protein
MQNRCLLGVVEGGIAVHADLARLGGDFLHDMVVSLGVDSEGVPVPDSTAALPPHSPQTAPSGGHLWTVQVSHRSADWP